VISGLVISGLVNSMIVIGLVTSDQHIDIG